MSKLGKYKKIIIILFVAIFLRLYKLGTIPPHLAPDEAALGYNAYSILKTGRDEYGKLLPIIFKSFGDYKPGLYIYLTVPIIALFGLTEFAVRLPSVLFGVVAVFLIYKIVKIFRLTSFASTFVKTTADKQNDKEKNHSPFTIHHSLALSSAFFLAISPWHIHFSRGAWEVNVALTFTLAGIYFFLRSFKNQKFLIFSSVSFFSTLLIYQGAKLSTAIVVLILIMIYWKELLRLERKFLAGSVIVGLLISFPIILSLFTGKTERLAVFSVFSYPRGEKYLQDFLDQGQENIGDLSYYLFHPEALNFARGIMGRWFNYVGGRFLFFEGDWQNLRHSIPNQGVLLFSDLFLLIAGFIGLIRYGWKKETKFIWLWLILAPLPAVLSRDQVQAVRAFNMVIPLAMISAFGFMFFVKYLGSVKFVMRLRVMCCVFLITIFMASFIYFLDAYFIHLPIHNARYWNYGYKQTVQKISQIQDDYNDITFQQSYNQPYIYFLFFNKYDPATYQQKAELTESGTGDVGLVERLDNVIFRRFSWPQATGKTGTLIAGDSIAIPPEYSTDDYLLISEIKYPGGFETAFRILEVK